MERVCLNRFLLSEFAVQKRHFECTHVCDARNGRERSSFYFVLGGRVNISSAGRDFSAHTGDIVYFPDGVKHFSEWTGTPDITYIDVSFRFSPLREMRMDKNFGIHLFSGEKSAETFALGSEIYEKFTSSDEKRLLAIADFYVLWNRLLPAMNPNEKTLFSPQITLAVEFIEREYRRDFDMAEICAEVNMSESRLYHKFREEVHTSPVAYRNGLRVGKAMEYLKDSVYNVGEIGEMLGFGSGAYFRKTFAAVTGVSPKDYRKMWRVGDETIADKKQTPNNKK